MTSLQKKTRPLLGALRKLRIRQHLSLLFSLLVEMLNMKIAE
jgi:hypothetical protein